MCFNTFEPKANKHKRTKDILAKFINKMPHTEQKGRSKNFKDLTEV